MIEIHFFHGFLGNPLDWRETLSGLIGGDYKLVVHNLLQDFKNLNETWSMENWATKKNEELNQSSSPKVLVGYSMGARLMLQLEDRNTLAWVALSGHPGLRDEEARLSRRKWLDSWLNRSKDLESDQWIRLWNDQPIFKNDKYRPDRRITKEDWKIWLKIMESTSLDKQMVLDPLLEKRGSKVWWICGSDDEKYQLLKNRMEEILGQENVKTIEGAGHGLPFDTPLQVSQWLKEIVKDVE